MRRTKASTPRHELLAVLRAAETPLEPGWLPTQAEIREACRRIQSTWGDAEREKRNQRPIDPLTIPDWPGVED